MKKLKTSIIIFFCLQVAGMLVWTNISKPRLLILHSYHADYAWVRDINVGLKRVLNANSHIFIRWHYLDTKRHPAKEYKQSSAIAARRVIDSWKPDVIIAMDDDAQEYVAKYYANRKGISVVFGGVNNRPSDYGYDKADNVTGVLERLPLEAVKEGLLSFTSTGATPSVFFLGDLSETVQGDERWVKDYNWSPVRLAGTKLVDSLDEWKTAVKKAAGATDYILVSNYRKIFREKGGKELVPPEELIRITQEMTKVPVIGTNAFFAEDGGMFAIATSPFEQGDLAGKMALPILRKEKTARDIPIVDSHQSVVSMSESKMKQFGFKVPLIYEACARAGNYYYK